jgi:membrane protein
MKLSEVSPRPIFCALTFRRARAWSIKHLRACCAAIWEAYARFARRRHLLYAAAISYYGIISLVRFLALVLSVLGFYLRAEQSRQAIRQVLTGLSPVQTEFLLSAARAIAVTSPWAMVLYGLGLLWAGAYLFESIERVINAIWHGTIDRAFHVRKLIAMGVVLVAAILLLSSIAVSAAWASLGNLSHLTGGEWEPLRRSLKKAAILIPLMTSTGMFTLLLKFLPTKKVPIRAALAGGIFCGLSWELSKWLFGLFVALSGRNYGSLYGSLANIVIIMLWIHLTAVILIMGAHIACIVQERVELKSTAEFWLKY